MAENSVADFSQKRASARIRMDAETTHNTQIYAAGAP